MAKKTHPTLEDARSATSSEKQTNNTVGIFCCAKNESFGIIELTQGKFAIVDNDMVSTLKRYHWRAVKHKRSFYAKTTIRRCASQYDLGMHRFVAQTPRGQVPHHINLNSLDNRRANLQNMSKSSHTLLHANNRIKIQFEDNYPRRRL